MNETPPKIGQLITGLLFNEPMRVETVRANARISTVADHPGDWTTECHRADRRAWRRDPVQARPPVGGLARIGPTGTLDGRHAPAPWDQDSIHTLHTNTPSLRKASPLSILFIRCMGVLCPYGRCAESRT